MKRSLSLYPALFLAALLVGCASGVTRMDAPTTGTVAAPAQLADPTVKAVTIQLSDAAKKLVIDNLKFNSETLRSTIERALSGQSLIKPESRQSMTIEITSFRARSNFSAIMFGIMAGTDNVEGIVTVMDAAGAVLKRSKINASYGLGGLAGGQDDARMNWLYEEFAKLTVAEMTGVGAK